MDNQVKEPVTSGQKRGVGEVALQLLTDENLRFTDLHIASDEPVMLRRATNDWITAPNESGGPLVMSHQAILSFLNGMFTGSMAVPPEDRKAWPTWLTELHQRGALHHAVTLNDDSLANGVPEGMTLDDLSCRVRCTIQLQSMKEKIGLVMRPLKRVPKDLMGLGLPIQLSSILKSASSGLIVVTGPTGAGKSTTLATMVGEINALRPANILTLEDPVEFVHERAKGIINQREVGMDVVSFEHGVTDALRFVPDVIMIGEIRNEATMRAALRAAESGHLVLTSMHAPTAGGAIRKMVSYLSGSDTAAQDVAGCLVAVVAQALIRSQKEEGGCFLAYELLDATKQQVHKLITQITAQDQGRANGLDEALRAGQLEGSLPLIKSVRELIGKRHVDPRRAAMALVNPEDRAELLQMVGAGGGSEPRGALSRQAR